MAPKRRFQRSHDSLLKAANRLIDQLDHKPIADLDIARFLSETSNLGLTPSECLTALTFSMQTELGWKNICVIFEEMLRRESPDEQLGSYTVWLDQSLEFWLTSESPLTYSERKEVSEQTFQIFERAFASSSNNPGLALSLGIYYLSDAFRDEDSFRSLERALDSFRRAIEWAYQNNDFDMVTLGTFYKAGALFELKDWKEALSAYEFLDLEILEQWQGPAVNNEIQEKIRQCKLELGL